MSEKLLIVEDDKKLNDGIRLALKNDASISIKWNFSKMENLLNLVRQNKSSLECCVKTEEKY